MGKMCDDLGVYFSYISFSIKHKQKNTVPIFKLVINKIYK